jgi:hypothetical protein
MATNCKCGWKSQEHSSNEKIPCKFENCPNPAMISETTIAGKVNMCCHHYDQYHAEQSKKWCQTNNLMSREDQMKFIKTTLKDPKFMRPKFRGKPPTVPVVPTREPGETDDYTYAS